MSLTKSNAGQTYVLDNMSRLEESSNDQQRHRSIEQQGLQHLSEIEDNVRRVWNTDGLSPAFALQRSLGLVDFEDTDSMRNSRIKIRDLEKITNQNLAILGEWLGKQIKSCKDERQKSSLLTLKDNVDRVDHSMFFKKVILESAQMPRERASNLVSLFRQIKLEGRPTIQFPAFGTIRNAEKIGPHSVYPEVQINYDSKQMVQWGKWGLGARMPDEILQQSAYPIMQIYMSLISQAFTRTKETEAANHITTYSQPFIDNRGSFNIEGSATAGTFTTRGTDASASLNGTLTVADLFSMYSKLIAEGFTPDTLIGHAFSWIVFAQSAELRSLVYSGGEGGAFFQTPTGDLGRYDGSEPNLGVETNNTANLATTQATLSNKLPFTMNMHVSAYMPYETDARVGDTGAPGYPMPTVDLHMADSSRVGVLWTDSFGLDTSTEFYDPKIDMRKMIIREYWSMTVDAEGKGMISAKGVKAGEMGFDLESRMQLSIPYAPAPTVTQLTPNVN